MTKLKENDIVVGTITGIQKYGIFVSMQGYCGLIHISEISDGYVKDVSDYAKMGEQITSRILEIDEEKKRLKLSIKALDESKTKYKKEKIIETKTGFLSLQNQMDGWIEKKITEIGKKKEKMC